MSTRPSGPGLSARVAIFFAANPGEELTTNDIISKFDEHRASNSVHSSLAEWVAGGWLQKTVNGPGRGHHALYSAGPALREMIGIQP